MHQLQTRGTILCPGTFLPGYSFCPGTTYGRRSNSPCFCSLLNVAWSSPPHALRRHLFYYNSFSLCSVSALYLALCTLSLSLSLSGSHDRDHSVVTCVMAPDVSRDYLYSTRAHLESAVRAHEVVQARREDELVKHAPNRLRIPCESIDMISETPRSSGARCGGS